MFMQQKVPEAWQYSPLKDLKTRLQRHYPSAILWRPIAWWKGFSKKSENELGRNVSRSIQNQLRPGLRIILNQASHASSVVKQNFSVHKNRETLQFTAFRHDLPAMTFRSFMR
jgi:hypothetical protein